MKIYNKWYWIGLALFLVAGVSLQAQGPLVPANTPVDNGKPVQIVADKKEGGPVVAFQAFGVLQTYDLDTAEGGVGLGIVVNLTDYLGLEAEGYSFDYDGIFVDRGAASVRYNILTKTKSRPYLFGGAWYNFEEQDAYGFHAGVGVAHQFAKFFTPFADVRFHKPLNGSDTATSCIARAGLSFGF